MNEANVRALADMAVAAGTTTRAQADEWVAADVAALAGAAPAAAPGAATTAAPPSDGGNGAAPPVAAPDGPLAASGASSPWEGTELPEGFGPPTTPAGYRFDQLVAEPLTLDQMQNVAATFHAARMPAPIASQVASEIAAMARQPLDEAGLTLLNARTMTQLQALWGDSTAAKINTARAFVHDLEKVRPGVLKLLEDSGAGSSPVVIRQLVLHAERLAAARRK